MRRLNYANVMATIAVVLAAGGGSFAIAQSSSKGTIRGCMNKKSGVLRALSNPGKRCKRSERAISWNVKGRAGTDGAPGAPGMKGADGAPGQTGAAGSPDTAEQVLDKLLTVDGQGSGLDADLLDGINSHRFPLEIGAGAKLAEYPAEAQYDPGECVDEYFPGIGGVTVNDFVLASVRRAGDEILPPGLLTSAWVVRHVEGEEDVPRVVVRICNVTPAVIASTDLSIRVLVYR